MENDKASADPAVSALTVQRSVDFATVPVSAFAIVLSMLLALMTYGWGLADSSPQYELGTAKVLLILLISIVSVIFISVKRRMHVLQLLVFAGSILANFLIVSFCQSYEVFKVIEPALVWERLLVSGIATCSLFSSHWQEDTYKT